MNRSTWITTLVVIGAIAVAVILEATKAEPAPIQDTTSVTVKIKSAQANALPGAALAGGFLRARLDITISAERAGRIVALPVAEGATAQRNAILAEIDATAAAANLARARTVLQELQLTATTPATELARATEAVTLAEDEWSARHPRAPWVGVVDLHHVDVGEYVRPGTPLVDVVDLSALILDVDVDPESAVSLSVGDQVKISVRALESTEFAGEVSRVARRAGRTTRRFRVEIVIDAKGAARSLRPGMYARAQLQLPAGAPAIYLPKEAIREVRAQRGVFVVSGTPAVVAWQPVRVFEVHHRPDLWRAEGLQEGMSVVVEGFAGLREGQTVEVTR